MSHFNESLCSCMEDMPSCLMGSCIPGGCCCLQASAVNKATQKGSCVPYLCVCCLLCIGGAINRGNIRQRYSYDGSFINDCCIWLFCFACAGCQEYRETKRKGNT